MLAYQQPKSLEQALSLLDSDSDRARPYAGGTDLLPRWSRGSLPRPDIVVDLKAVEGLRGISQANGEVRLGACTALADVASDSTIHSAAMVLARAANRIACPQIRNRGTIGGNLCNASPAADTAIPLILLDAVVDIASGGSDRARPNVREVAVADFFRGPGSTVIEPNEVLTAIRFKPRRNGIFTAWDKFGTRPAMEIAIASAGVALEVEDGTVIHARVGYGSVAPVPMRGRSAEAALTGCTLDATTIDACVTAACDEIEPITDVRATAAYRRTVVGVMLRRMLERAANQSQS